VSFYVIEAQLSDLGLTPISVASRLGLEAVFLTSRIERYSDLATADEVFDKHVARIIQADTNDVASVLDAIRADSQGEPIDGVFTTCDYNIVVMAEVAKALSLRAISPSTALKCRNKAETRHALDQAGVAIPGFVHARNEGELETAVSTVGLPCVVKPMTESASVDVRLCTSHDEVRSHFRVINDRKRDARGQERPPGALIEQYLLGYEISVETFSDAGTVTVLGVTDKRLGPTPVFAEIADSFPSQLPESLLKNAIDTCLAGLEAVGHDFGAAHTEIRMVGGTAYIIEINGRLGGDSIPHLLRGALAIDMMEQVVRLAAGMPVDLTRQASRAAAWRDFSPAVGGRVREIRGVELAATTEGVVEVEIYAAPGVFLDAAQSNHQTFGHVLVVADTTSEADRLAEVAANHVIVEFERDSISDVPTAARGIDP